jgi:hypothetical protein
MKTIRINLPALPLIIVLLSPASSLACNVCHSKNPKMVRMHEALEFKNCFTCHGPGAKKMDGDPKTAMMSDERCFQCHKK